MHIGNEHIHPHYSLSKTHTLKELSTIKPGHIYLFADFQRLR